MPELITLSSRELDRLEVVRRVRERRLRLREAHQPRARRDCCGELVQIDGCQHDWFEGRGPYCTLRVYVDDATGKLMELQFVPSESAFDYFRSTIAYLKRHGRPVAFYSDKHSIFRVYAEGATGRSKGVTQFGRALGELNIDIICANTPQAKGRVERVHQTLQDRLVKELRLRGIGTMEDGNAFLPEFMDDHNRRFGRPPRTRTRAGRASREPSSIDAYLATLDAERRDLLARLRRTIRAVLPDAVEHISYGMPSFQVHGRVVAGFQATARDGSFYPFSGSTLDVLGDALAAFSRTKSAFHFTADRPLSAPLVRKLLRARLAELPRTRASRRR